MKVAIVGSRDYPRMSEVRAYVATLPDDAVVVSGGARGVDSIAEHAARARGLEVLIFPADWKTHGKAAGFIRNRQIVEVADVVVAFWDNQSNGTWDTIKRAMEEGIPTFVNPVRWAEA